jgi:hypothetical protein
VATGRYLCKMYNYHDSQACGYKRSRILSRLVGLVCGMVGMILVQIRWIGVIHSDPFSYHTLRLIQLKWVVIAYNFNIEDMC